MDMGFIIFAIAIVAIILFVKRSNAKDKNVTGGGTGGGGGRDVHHDEQKNIE